MDQKPEKTLHRRNELNDETHAKINLFDSMFSHFGALAIDVAQRTDVEPAIVAEGMMHGVLRVLAVVNKNTTMTHEEEVSVIETLRDRLVEAYFDAKKHVDASEKRIMQTMGLKAPDGAFKQ